MERGVRLLIPSWFQDVEWETQRSGQEQRCRPHACGFVFHVPYVTRLQRSASASGFNDFRSNMNIIFEIYPLGPPMFMTPVHLARGYSHFLTV